MNIQEFKKEVVRTMPDLGSLLLNSIHMTLGMGSELMEEMTIAFHQEDKVNLSEELCDAQWYGCNYATLYNIPLPEEIVVVHPEEASRKRRKAYYDDLRINLGKLQDFDKKELAYGKMTDILTRSSALYKVLESIEFIALDHQVNMNEGRAKVIAKLRLRYPEKFTYEAAINRDVKAERKILES